MQFLAHEVNLEYEAPLIARNLIETKKKKEQEAITQAQAKEQAKVEAAKLTAKKKAAEEKLAVKQVFLVIS
jgi:hypothetical protein